jgi:hypothetical protein
MWAADPPAHINAFLPGVGQSYLVAEAAFRLFAGLMTSLTVHRWAQQAMGLWG